VHILPAAPHGTTDQMSPEHAAVPAEGQSPKEAIRALKRRISDAVYRQLLADSHR